MCLGIAMKRPNDVLAHDKHEGFEWMIIHNGTGHRCGYVRIPKGHPWHGQDMDDIGPEVHGGITFAAYDEPCDQPGGDDAYWIGFDCAHAWDAPDLTLPCSEEELACRKILKEDRAKRNKQLGLGEDYDPWGSRAVRTQEYVIAECKSLCEQAKEAAI